MMITPDHTTHIRRTRVDMETRTREPKLLKATSILRRWWVWWTTWCIWWEINKAQGSNLRPLVTRLKPLVTKLRMLAINLRILAIKLRFLLSPRPRRNLRLLLKMGIWWVRCFRWCKWCRKMLNLLHRIKISRISIRMLTMLAMEANMQGRAKATVQTQMTTRIKMKLILNPLKIKNTKKLKNRRYKTTTDIRLISQNLSLQLHLRSFPLNRADRKARF